MFWPFSKWIDLKLVSTFNTSIDTSKPSNFSFNIQIQYQMNKVYKHVVCIDDVLWRDVKLYLKYPLKWNKWTINKLVEPS